jgi:hypothetical protein
LPHRTTLRTTTSRSALAPLLALVLLVGCADVGAGDAAAPGASTSATAAPSDPLESPAATPEVEIDGRDLVLVTDEGRTTVATLEDGLLVDAQLRPGDRPGDGLTVLALGRTADSYELRYVNVVDGAATDLYWFPFRLQVDPGTAAITDVPTLPVWAPDGSAVAWLEWTADGTRLRTVGWLDHDAGTNPSDDQATYALTEVPVGTQLAAWEVEDDGTPVLVTAGEPRWRIRVEDGGAVVALDELG